MSESAVNAAGAPGPLPKSATGVGGSPSAGWREAFRPSEPFRPAPGVISGHAQTIFAALVRPGRAPALARERWDTPDGDFVDIDFLPAPSSAPHLLILHGLEGSSRASYVTELLRGAQRRGWGAVALNFRCCSGEENRLPRFYHSGEFGDALFVAERVRQRISGPLFGIGFSLGGNVLLVLLAQKGSDAPFDAAAAISAPYDLSVCARRLDGGKGIYRLYRWRFLRTLRRKALRKLRSHPGIFDPKRVRASRGIAAFDDAVTAPIHGFRDAVDYYRQCSSGPLLSRIRCPTLLISSKDDPLAGSRIPAEALTNPFLVALETEHGGHVGFVGGSIRRPQFWAERQALEFFASLS